MSSTHAAQPGHRIRSTGIAALYGRPGLRARAKAAIGELRDLARGIHPPVLDRDLAEALQSLAAHSPVRVVVTVDLPRRPAPAIETIAYFCASELVINVARHSDARQATVDVLERDGALELRVSDDGVGGAGTGTNGGTRAARLGRPRPYRRWHAVGEQPGRRADRRHRPAALARPGVVTACGS